MRLERWGSNSRWRRPQWLILHRCRRHRPTAAWLSTAENKKMSASSLLPPSGRSRHNPSRARKTFWKDARDACVCLPTRADEAELGPILLLEIHSGGAQRQAHMAVSGGISLCLRQWLRDGVGRGLIVTTRTGPLVSATHRRAS